MYFMAQLRLGPGITWLQPHKSPYIHLRWIPGRIKWPQKKTDPRIQQDFQVPIIVARVLAKGLPIICGISPF